MHYTFLDVAEVRRETCLFVEVKVENRMRKGRGTGRDNVIGSPFAASVLGFWLSTGTCKAASGM